MVSSRERGADAVSVLLIRRRRPIGEPMTLEPIGSAGTATTDGVAGAGRIAHALLEAGVHLDAVEQLVLPADIGLQELRELDLGRRFDTVVLGSHLVNLPDDDRRAAFLAFAGRQATADGVVLVEHHPIDWAQTADDVQPTPGGAVGMLEVRREAPFVSAVSVYDVGGHEVRQPFTARVLSEAELADSLASARLRVTRRLSPSLLESGRADSRSAAWESDAHP
jgi:hypothetical protein